MMSSVYEKLLGGKYKVEHTALPPTATREERQANHLNNNRREGEATARFRADLEAEEGTDKLPEAVRDRVWSLAWEHGHAYGYSEVYGWYDDFGDLAKLAYEAGIKSTR